MPYGNNKDADQRAHLGSLIIFVVHCLGSTLSCYIRNSKTQASFWRSADQFESYVPPNKSFLMTWFLHMSRLMTKPTKWQMRPAKTQISLSIRPVWSESSLSAWRKLGSLATHWALSKDSDQTGWMPSLIWVFAGHSHFDGFLMRRLLHIYLWWSPVWQQSEALHFWVSQCLPWTGTITGSTLEPSHEKTCLRGLRPGKTQTGLLRDTS